MSLTVRNDVRVIAVLAAALSATACTTVAPVTTTSIATTAPDAQRAEIFTGPSVQPPIGLLDFCRRSPADCGADTPQANGAISRESGVLYWQAVFSPAKVEQTIPASLSRPSPSDRFDWSAVFGAGASATEGRGSSRDGDGSSGSPQATREPAVNSPAAALAAVTEPLIEAPTAARSLVDRNSTQWKAVKAANRQVNRSIRRGSDAEVYGTPDYWQAGLGGRGDCEDYVLTKRRLIIAAGVPADALTIALVRTRWGEDHAILLVATTDGEYVLDNLNPWINRWDTVDYQWRQRQLAGDVFRWISLLT